MITVKIYTKEDCHLCEEAKRTLVAAQGNFFFELEEIDITTDKTVYEEFRERIPVIFINGKMAFKYRVEEKELKKRLGRLFRRERRR